MKFSEIIYVITEEYEASLLIGTYFCWPSEAHFNSYGVVFARVVSFPKDGTLSVLCLILFSNILSTISLCLSYPRTAKSVFSRFLSDRLLAYYFMFDHGNLILVAIPGAEIFSQ